MQMKDPMMKNVSNSQFQNPYQQYYNKGGKVGNFQTNK